MNDIKRNGFTLTELLAVIVIMAMIALITVPVVKKFTTKAKTKAFKTSVLKVVSVAQEYANDNNISKPYTFDLSPSNNVLDYEEGTIKSGRIILGVGNHTIVENVSDGKVCVNGTINNLKVEKGKCPTSYTTYFGVENIINNAGSALLNDSESGTYYYQGANPNNYVSYLDKIWRIVSIQNGRIKLILNSNSATDSTYSNLLTTLVSNYYDDEDIRSDYILDTDWHNGLVDYTTNLTSVDVKDIEASEHTENKKSIIGALTVSEYYKAGGSSSFLNISGSSWLLNAKNSSNAYKLDSGNVSAVDISTSNIKIRPVIVLKDSLIISGSGTSSNPYKIN